MTNVATALKSEIQRLARREIKSEIASLRSASTRYRTEIASLKRQVQQLESKLKRSVKAVAKTSALDASEDGNASALRFRAAGFAKLRQKLGISAADMGKLLNVSSISVYKWEQGKAHPRSAQLQAIAAIRKIGKKEAAARLASMDSSASSPR